MDDTRDRGTAAEVRRLAGRVEKNEREVLRIRNTVSAVFNETDELSIAGPCSNCDQSFLIVRQENLYCPRCGYRRTL